MENPIIQFNTWYQEERSLSKVRIPSACCLSTIGQDGFPNSRFVSLKETQEEAFIITGTLNSRKGRELSAIPKASITFWWTETERQVRIQGIVRPISNEAADAYFFQRNQDSQIVSTIFNQGEDIESLQQLNLRFEKAKAELQDQNVNRPEQWSGFRIEPIRIEFMEFKATRLHERTLFTKQEGAWQKTFLQP